MPSAQDIVFVIPGQLMATRSGAAPSAPRGGLPGRVKASVRVGTRRAGGAPVRLSATPGEDVVVLHVAGGPALVLHPETARDLLLGQGKASRSAGLPDEVAVPAQLHWSGLEAAAATRTRGFLGDVLLQAVEVLTGLVKDEAADFVAGRVVAAVDGQVDAGVYELKPETLGALKGQTKLDRVDAAGEPMLVLLHGTFVDTASTFAKLWTQHPALVRGLFERYEGRVYALDHPTLGASPLANALTLVQALPDGARLHLATHSRGGLVAEVLARLCGQGGKLGAADLAPFADPADAEQRRELVTLAALVKARGIRVERLVRVACPARGTLLASRRLDAYVSVLRWTLQLAGVPVAPALLDFLGEVARRRADPSRLPGLAAMVPDSPLVRWLNAADEPIPGELRVVAGDLEGDSLGGWVKTLLADAFYWTDNDIVVQTRSMYGGTPRAGGASFLLDQGGKVTHFNYFGNERTATAVVDALLQDRPSGFRPIGPLSWAGQDSSGLRAARVARDGGKPAHERPAVFVLPGILGSHLKVGDQRVWLSLRLIGGLSQLAWKDGAPDGVSPDGPIGMIYDGLIDHLADSHEVIPFAFDWRRPIEDEARRLAQALTLALDARDASRQPVRLLAHSMGGVVARTVQIVAPAVWLRLMARDGARLLMLGTPNGGSWAPMQVLSGDDRFGNMLAAFGAPFQDHEARALMAGMPGFLQLQAGLFDEQRKLTRSEAWQALADRDLATVHEANWWHRNVFPTGGNELQLNPYRWGVPPQKVLDQAVALREKLDAQRERDLPGFASKLLLVAGKAPFTPDGWAWSDEGLVYRNAVDGGDGRVVLASALLPGVRTWTLDCEHGSLPAEEAAFGAYVELLERGDTDHLDRLASPARGGAAPAVATHLPSRPSRGVQPDAARPAQSMLDLLATPATMAPEALPRPGSALGISIVNGDLSFVRQPLLVGHYRSPKVTGTESVVDRMIGGAMQASLDAGLYPQKAGSHQVFVNAQAVPDNPWQAPRPEAAIVIGLGDEGSLKGPELVRAIRQATLAWLQRLSERREGAPASVTLAATLIGSGGLGVTPGDSACAIARGVREAADLVRMANQARRDEQPDGAIEWPVVTRLKLVEIYLERAAEAWRALQVLATATPGHFEIDPLIASGTGPLRRQIDTTYRGAGYDLISVESAGQPEGTIAFRLDTRRARSEVRASVTQAKLVRDLVKRASHDANDDRQIGHTLFQLLVPQELEAYLGGTDRMLLELDDGTAPIPWELLDLPEGRRAGGDARPWSIRCRLLRKLRKTEVRLAVQDATAEDHVLVVGEPALHDPRYVALPGALKEARAVAEALQGAGGLDPGRVRQVLHGESTTILNALFALPYRIVHIAGHGEPADKAAGHDGGVVMSDGTFLGPREIAKMRTVPELVFVNCCHLAKRDEAQLLAAPPAKGGIEDRAAFAYGVADKLIEIGVRCVVAAGWAVEDEPAALFAATLYRELLAGRRFIDAVAQAREEAWRHADGGNTWAAYQCYGDPDWVLRAETADAQGGRGDTLVEDYESLASPLGLALALEKLAVESRFQSRGAARQLDHIRHLEARFGPAWGGMGAVAEAFGVAYSEAKAFEPAVAWFARAVAANDGSASMRATEQWLNLRARLALDRAQADAGAAAGAELDEVLQQLAMLARLQPTIERHSLCGSAWKRLAMLEARQAQAAPDAAAARQHAAAAARARREAAASYEQAERLAVQGRHPDLFYPALNRMATALAAHAPGDAAWAGFDAEVVARVRQSLLERVERDPDFWSMVGAIEVDAFEAVAAGRLGADLEALLVRARDLQQRVAAPRSWASVADTADYALAAWGAAATAGEKAAVERWRATLRGWAR